MYQHLIQELTQEHDILKQNFQLAQSVDNAIASATQQAYAAGCLRFETIRSNIETAVNEQRKALANTR